MGQKEMDVLPPLFIEIKSSNLKLYFLITIHALAILAILLIDDFGLIGIVLKILFIILVSFSLNQFFSQHKRNIKIYFKIDGQIDLTIDDQDYYDLQLNGKSYVSNYFMQLIFIDKKKASSHNISIFPDAIDASMHAQLRTRLKISDYT